MSIQDSLRGRLGGLPREYWLLLAGMFVHRVGTFVQPFLVLYLVRERGTAESTAGLLLAVYGLAGLPSQIVGGVLADRVGRRETLLLGSVGFAAALGVLGAARSLPLIVLGVALTGATADVYRPASAALVADVVAPEDRVRAFGLHFWVINLGWATATSIAGLLAERGYGLLFGLDALTTVVFGLVVYRGIGDTRPQRDHRSSPGSFRDPFRDRLMLGVIASWFLYSCVYFQGFITLPLAMTADGLSLRTFGLVIALNGLIIVVVQPLVLGRLGRLPRVPTAAWSIALVGVGFSLHGWADTGWEHAGAVAVWTLGEIGTSSVGATLVAEISPPHLRGRYAGAFGFTFGAAAVVAPIVGTMTFEHVGAGAVWGGALVVAGAGAIVQLMLAPALAARTALADSGA